MSEEQLNKEAQEYALSEGMEIMHSVDYKHCVKDYKAGYRSRDKEVEELNDELEELRLYKHSCNESIAHLHRENDRLNEFIKDLGNQP